MCKIKCLIYIPHIVMGQCEFEPYIKRFMLFFRVESYRIIFLYLAAIGHIIREYWYWRAVQPACYLAFP